MSKVKIKTLTKDDWPVYKFLRLNSLSDSPDAFGSTFEAESRLTDEDWSARLDYEARNMQGSMAIAMLDSQPVGLACGIIHQSGDQEGHVYQMWVSPEARGVGAGRLLLSHIISWSKDSGLIKLSLAVTLNNKAAINLYRALGFIFDGALEDLREGSILKMQPMKLDLTKINL